MSRPSCQYLTHKFASFYGCTLGEIAFIVLAYLCLDTVVISISSLFLGRYVGGYSSAFLLQLLVFLVLTFFVFLKFTARKIGKWRKGRQARYLTLKSRLVLHQTFGFSTPYVMRNGMWIRKRSMKS